MGGGGGLGLFVGTLGGMSPTLSLAAGLLRQRFRLILTGKLVENLRMPAVLF